ncbi:MAG TPA: hypothetical protein VFS43_29180 [Polyangiaceae bacterium]|nr:hypothetical protein [Polyangiaceae bacterium]
MRRLVLAPLAAALALGAGGCERRADAPSVASATAPAGRPEPAPRPAVTAPGAAAAAPSPAAGGATAPSASAEPRRAPHFVEMPAETGLLDAIRGEARAAGAAGETLVVYVGARWCKPCQHFERALASGKLDASLAGLRLLHVDLDTRGAELGAHGYATKVIPYFVVPTAKGAPSARKFSTEAMGGEVVDQIVAGLAPFRPGH